MTPGRTVTTSHRAEPAKRAAVRLDLGLYPNRTARENVSLAALAESLGFGGVWVTDSPILWRELWVTLTAIAGATTRIGLASAVTSGVTRHPSVTASAALTLSELSGGRFVLGLGNGDSALATIGGRPQTLGGFRETVAALRTLLDGEVAKVGPIGIRVPWAAGPRVPLYVAASGPRMLELAGAVADGVIMMVGVADTMVRAAIERVRAGAVAASRDPDDMRVVLWTACAVSDRAPADAIAAVKATVARSVIRKLPLPIPAEHAAAVERIRAQYDYSFHSNARAPHARLVPDALVGSFAIAGTSASCVEQLRALAPLGLSAVVLAPPDAAFEDRRTMLARLAGSVLPEVGAA